MFLLPQLLWPALRDKVHTYIVPLNLLTSLSHSWLIFSNLGGNNWTNRIPSRLNKKKQVEVKKNGNSFNTVKIMWYNWTNEMKNGLNPRHLILPLLQPLHLEVNSWILNAVDLFRCRNDCVTKKIKKGSKIFYQNATSRWGFQVLSAGNDHIFLRLISTFFGGGKLLIHLEVVSNCQWVDSSDLIVSDHTTVDHVCVFMDAW